MLILTVHQHLVTPSRTKKSWTCMEPPSYQCIEWRQSNPDCNWQSGSSFLLYIWPIQVVWSGEERVWAVGNWDNKETGQGQYYPIFQEQTSDQCGMWKESLYNNNSRYTRVLLSHTVPGKWQVFWCVLVVCCWMVFCVLYYLVVLYTFCSSVMRSVQDLNVY